MIAVCLVFALVLFLPPILNDGDTLWQIRTGEWILAHHAIPATDPFSFTAGDRPWFAHEWLAETLLALAWRAGGMPGVMALAAAATGLTAAILLHDARRFLPGIYAVLALIVALANAAPSMLARPHLLAWPCLALWCAGWCRPSQPHRALLPAAAGDAAVGQSARQLHHRVAAAAAFLPETLFDRPSSPNHSLLGRLHPAAGAVTLLNPEGLAGCCSRPHGRDGEPGLDRRVATDRFRPLAALELIILAGLVLGLSGKVAAAADPPADAARPDPRRFGARAERAASRHRRRPDPGRTAWRGIGARPRGAIGRTMARLASGAIGLAAIALAGRLILPLDEQRTGAAFAATIDRVPEAVRAQPVLNEYGLGGQLIFQGVRPFIDSRADLYGDAFLTRYRAIASGTPDALASALAEYRIAWTIFPAGHRVNDALDQLPGWQRRIEADGLVVHIHQDATAGGPGADNIAALPADRTFRNGE